MSACLSRFVTLNKYVIIETSSVIYDIVAGYRSRGPGSILGATRLSEKQWVSNGVPSASTT
jgi:hypothetical protein